MSRSVRFATYRHARRLSARIRIRGRERSGRASARDLKRCGRWYSPRMYRRRSKTDTQRASLIVPQAHNLKVGGSNPPPATKSSRYIKDIQTGPRGRAKVRRRHVNVLSTKARRRMARNSAAAPAAAFFSPALTVPGNSASILRSLSRRAASSLILVFVGASARKSAMEQDVGEDHRAICRRA